MSDQLAIGGVIYAIRLRRSYDYRYVGLTTKSAELRLRQHLKVATSGRKTPFYGWLRKQRRDDVCADVLDWVDGLAELGEAEVEWIAYLRRDGQPLLNLSDGGLGPMGIEWTQEMREAARIRSTGRKGVSRFAVENPFFRRSHSAEQRAKWSADRRGTNQGALNPNFGKFGAEHPSFGHSMTEESKRRLSEQRRGDGNPNFGRKGSAETRAKMSAVRKGRPMPSSKRSAHTRYHTNKRVFKDTCQYCVEDAGRNPNG
ncbi:NUMOD3 domain-containing DNA-binding protein [Gordonia sp. N1V]|uniref:NUMOD3 domain-containing DNA-binding protein n=1 Tax=Gordonia sp. N1V TaxID=3034163 RepID=UPI0023E1DD8C|nr:NUMOD3 domain-containing DNA-binding protein [Gordonia sp. N1V]MDF3283698.1 NUMOD3 domain-containing DNA-binding protein [Gordonia sp. N1V]